MSSKSFLVPNVHVQGTDFELYIASLVTPAMYKGRLEGFSFMTEIDIKQMAV